MIQLSIDIPPGNAPILRPDYNSKLIKTIELLKNNNIKVNLQTTLHKSMVPFLDQLCNFSIKFDIPLGFNRLIPVGNAINLNNLFFNPQELRDTLKKLANLQKLNKLILCSDIFSFLIDKKKMDYFRTSEKKNIMGGCIAGVATLYVNVKGEILPCPFVNFLLGNVFDEKIQDVWLHNKILHRLRKRNTFIGKCGKCKYNPYCGGCRANAFLFTGSIFGSDINCIV